MDTKKNILTFGNQNLSEGTSERPLVTFALFAYNQEKYIREAIEGAFSQIYEPLEIIISDDESSDKTYEIIKATAEQYKGPHKLIINRNTENLGIGRHVNKIMQISRGEIIIASAGDDISYANRVSKIIETANKNKKAMSIWSSAEYINEKGEPINKIFPARLKKFTWRQMINNIKPVIGATHAWRRDVFDAFGNLNDDIYFEDNAISFRSFLIGDIEFINEPLVKYRQHNDNITNFTPDKNVIKLYRKAEIRTRWALSGVKQRIMDLNHAAQLIQESHPIKKYEKLLKATSRITELRLRAYQNYPNPPINEVLSNPTDKELIKVLIRSLLEIPSQKNTV